MSRRFIPPATLHRIYDDSPWNNPRSYRPDPIQPIRDRLNAKAASARIVGVACVALSIFCVGYFVMEFAR